MIAIGLSGRQTLAYGAFGLPLAMAALPVYVHVPRLYSDVTGMSLSLLGGLLLTARLVDAGIDPLLGAWSDRSARRQRLILLALPLLAIGMLALMHPPEAGAAWWLVGSMLLTYFSFSLASVAYQAWGTELGCDAGERTRLTASREGFGLLGVVLASVLPGLLSGTLSQGLSWLSQVFVGILFLCAAISLLAVPAVSSGPPRSENEAPGTLWQAFAEIRFRRLLTVFVLNGIAAALPATLVLFFVADVLQADAWGGGFLALYFTGAILFLPVWLRLAQAFGRVPAWVASMGIAMLAFSWAWGLGPGDGLSFAAICLLTGAALGADLTFPAALLADIANAATRRQAGVPQAGAYFGWWNLVAKFNLALAAGLSLPLLDFAGYRPGVAGAEHALSAVYCLLPLLFKTLAAVLVWRWRESLESSS